MAASKKAARKAAPSKSKAAAKGKAAASKATASKRATAASKRTRTAKPKAAETRSKGRPPINPSDPLSTRSVRLAGSQWAKVDKHEDGPAVLRWWVAQMPARVSKADLAKFSSRNGQAA